MALLAFNLSPGVLQQEGASENLLFTLPTSGEGGTRGPAVDVTSEMSGLLFGDYNAVQVAVDAGSLEFEWTGPTEFGIGAVVVAAPGADRLVELGYPTPTVFQEQFSASGAGARDIFVQVINESVPDVPFNCRIIDVLLVITTAVGGTATLRNAAGGAGVPKSEPLDTTSTGVVRPGAATVSTFSLVVGEPLYLRLSDGQVAGEIYVTVIPT